MKAPKSHGVRYAVLTRLRKQSKWKAEEGAGARAARLQALRKVEAEASVAATARAVEQIRAVLQPQPVPGLGQPVPSGAAVAQDAAPPSSPRATPVTLDDLGPAKEVPAAWSRVVAWTHTGREQRLAVVVSGAMDATGKLAGRSRDLKFAWVLWQDQLRLAPLCELFPYELGPHTRCLEWLASAGVESAQVILPTAVAPDGPAKAPATRLDPTLHHSTICLHANNGLWVSSDVHRVVTDFHQAANWVAKRAQQLFGEFVRLLLATAGPGPFAVSPGVWARLRAWHRRCWAASNPCSLLFNTAYADYMVRVQRGEVDDDLEEVGLGEDTEEGVQEDEEEDEEEDVVVEDGGECGVEEHKEETSAKSQPKKTRLSREDARELDLPVWCVLFQARDLLHVQAPCDSNLVAWVQYNVDGMSTEVDRLACRHWDSLVGEGMTGGSLSKLLTAHARQVGGAPASAVRRVVEAGNAMSQLQKEFPGLEGLRDGRSDVGWSWLDILTLYCHAALPSGQFRKMLKKAREALAAAVAAATRAGAAAAAGAAAGAGAGAATAPGAGSGAGARGGARAGARGGARGGARAGARGGRGGHSSGL